MKNAKNVTKLRLQLNYDDGSGPRCAVEFDSSYVLSKDDPQQCGWIKVEGVGGSVLIDARDLQFLRNGLEAIAEVL